MRARFTTWRWWNGAKGIPTRRSPICKEWWTQYPQSRDARRELGIAYYQQHSYEEATRAVRSAAGTSIRTIWPRTTTWRFCIAAWA